MERERKTEKQRDRECPEIYFYFHCGSEQRVIVVKCQGLLQSIFISSWFSPEGNECSSTFHSSPGFTSASEQVAPKQILLNIESSRDILQCYTCGGIPELEQLITYKEK